jgi:DNA-binding MarR family transcriptional regulator
VTQLVDRLEADGLVNRTADPNDRRSRLAVLTPAGRTAYSKGSEIQKQTERELFGVLTPTESETLHELLAKLQQ